MHYNVISADNHFNEPGDLFVRRVPAKYKDRAPRIVPTPDGGENWTWDGEVPARGFGLSSAVWQKGEPRTPDTFIVGGLKFSEMVAGSYDPRATVEDMRADGCDAAVFYPGMSGGIYGVKDKDYRLALMRAYNDWQAEWFSYEPNRLVGLAMLPTTEETLSEALQELERSIKLGFRAVVIPLFPARRYYDPWYDPLWEAAQEADVSINLHKGVGGWGGVGGFGALDAEGPFSSNQVVRDFAYALPIGDLIFSKVFERFPRLKVVSGEGRIGWLIHYVQRADESYRRHHHYQGYSLKELPSTYVKRNIFSTFIEDRMGVLMREFIGVDNQMWSSDFPHSDSTWPYSRQKIEEQFAGVPDDDRHKMLALNAARLYKLPVSN